MHCSAAKRRLLLLALVLAPVELAAAPSVAATFQGLGFLGTGTESWANAVSGDGSVVVGVSGILPSATERFPFRWTQATGMTNLSPLVEGAATGVTSDGATVVGVVNPISSPTATLWPDGAPAQPLPFPFATDLTPDASTVVGYGSDGQGVTTGILWTAATGVQYLQGTNDVTAAIAVSADGSIVVGEQTAIPSGQPSNVEAVRWVNGIGEVLVVFPGCDRSVSADVSADGTVVVGSCTGTSAPAFEQAFRWTTQSGMVGLGYLPGGSPLSQALAVSADGAVVVGNADVSGTWQAFVWDEVNGMRQLSDVLESQGVDLTGWVLYDAREVADDGRTIVGSGLNPAGDLEAFIAVLDAPAAAPVPMSGPAFSALLMAVAGTTGFLKLRR